MKDIITMEYFKIGSLNITITCDEKEKKLFHLITQELKSVKCAENSDIDLEINISREKILNYSPKYFSGNLSFNKTDFYKNEGNFNYIIKNLFENQKTELNIQTSFKTNFLLDFLSFFISRTFSNKEDKVKSSIMSYTLFWYIFQILLMKKKSSFLHSSILSLNGEGIILAGTGGCGKTSTAFKLLEDPNCKYLSEDFGIIDSEGFAYYNPKVLSIYASDVKYGQKDLVNYVKNGMNLIDQLQWYYFIFIGKNPLRKIPPDLILKDKICQSVKINKVYFLSRCSNETIKQENIEIEELTQRIANASFRELKQLYEVLTQIHSVGFEDHSFPKLEEIQEKTKNIYRKAFKDADRKILYVPKNAAPQDIIKFIKS